LKKWIWIENLIQLFVSKMDVDWIIKNPIHDHPYFLASQKNSNPARPTTG